MNETSLTNLQEEVFVFPASFAQQRLWFFHQLSPQSTAYNVSAAVRLYGTLNLIALQQTINEIIRRHEILRTNLAVIDGSLVQIVSPHRDQKIEIINLQAIQLPEKEIKIKQFVAEAKKYVFNLTTDNLFQIKLVQLSESEYVLLLVLHHIVADGWSIGVLLREFSTLYAAFTQGQPSPLAELPIQYADYANWQQEWMQSELLETQLSYWQQQLQNLPVLELPTDRPRPPVQSSHGAAQSITFSQGLTKKLERLSQQEGVSLFMLLLAAFQGLLFRYTGQTDIVVGAPIANRNQSELEELIGFFVNNLIIRTYLSDVVTFRELLAQVREVTLAAYAHQDLPFEKLVQVLQPQRDLSRNPLFQVSIALHNTPAAALELPNLKLEPFNLDTSTARLDLEAHFWQRSVELEGQIIYSTDLFSADTIDRLWQHFQILLEAVVAQPDRRIAEIPLISVAEQQQIIAQNLKNDHPKKHNFDYCIQYQFEAQAEKTPGAIALVFQHQQLSYQELNQRSNQLAHYLQQIGVQAEDLVGICMDRTPDMIIAVLAVLKARAAYVPLDPTYPVARLNYIQTDTQLSLIITQQQHCTKFNDLELQIICFDRDQNCLDQQSVKNLDSTTIGKNLAYVIYTSGSTGHPKGVLIEHQGLCNLLQAQRDVFRLQETDRVLQFASLNFDASIFEIALALGVGATLYLAEKKDLSGRNLLEFLHKHAITTVTLPPTILNSLPAEELPALHTIISAGEVCTPDLIKNWAREDRRFFNAYGPTEATVWSTISELSSSASRPVIGHPIANTQIYVLDACLQPVPVGVPGELYIAGVGLARGYLNQPTLTQEQFIKNPVIAQGKASDNSLGSKTIAFEHSTPARLYKTGDRVRYDADGNLEFLGRIDEQVKIRGYRIELGEIEAALVQHPAIQTVAVAVRNVIGYKQLIAYVIWKNSTPDRGQNLRHFLQAKLPEYLIPTVFIELESLPLTDNGKVDRQALQSINLPLQPDNNFHVVPRTPTEEKLLQLWQKLLQLNQVSVEDNFFDLGGDSLLAMRLVQEISQQFQPIPLAALFQAPTITQLALLLEQPQPRSAVHTPLLSQHHPLLVPIQSNGSKPPFFCIHPIFGVIFPYIELAHCLGKNQPLYALQPVGIDGKQSPCNRVESMATQYIEAIQTLQPEGPYLLGGWSFGGLVAFEMAQQLQAAGQSVALLAIFDAMAPVAINQPTLRDGIKLLLKGMSRSNFPTLIHYISRFLTIHRSEILPMLRVFSANSLAAYRYRSSIYPDQITLFKTAQISHSLRQDNSLGWNQLTTKPVQVRDISGSHLTLLSQPFVQQLAAQLQQCIDSISQK